jgi:predicted dehydrogenase
MKHHALRLIAPLAAFIFSLALHGQDTPKPLRAGIIGLDTSHVPAFTKLFNSPKADGELAGIKIVVGYPGGTDMPASATRVEKFTQTLREMGVEIVDTIPKLLEKVDVVFLESVDGRIHLKEAREVFKAGKPVFIDKPLAGNLAEAIAIVELAKRHKVPFFTSSSARFGEELRKLIDSAGENKILGAATWGPCSYQEGTPDFFFYGIHGVEPLFALMGTGCETVSRTKGPNNDQATGLWKDGRIGTYRGIVKGKADFGAVVYGDKGIAQAGKAGSYEPLCRQIGKFFRTLQPPVSAEETLEIFTFMEAADESLRQGGKPVALAEVYAKAKAEADKLIQ